jgi:hypothetical protein
MIQKTDSNEKNITITFIFLSLCILFLGAAPAFSQELTPVIVNSIGLEMPVGTPVEEIISAVSSGGLATSADIDQLKSDAEAEQAPETLVSSEQSLPDPAPAIGFNPDSIQQLEQQGGLSSSPQVEADAPTAFKLAVKFFERAVFKKDVEFASRPKFDEGLEISGVPTFDKDTAGYAIIKKGNQSVAIEFETEYNSPPIITATLSLQQYKNVEVRAAAEDLLLISDVKYIVTNVSKKGFEIMMDRVADSDIPLSWHALSVDKPKTYKKEGSSLDENKSAAESTSGASSQSGNPSKVTRDAGPAAVEQSERSSSLGEIPGSSSNNLQNQPLANPSNNSANSQ